MSNDDPSAVDAFVGLVVIGIALAAAGLVLVFGVQLFAAVVEALTSPTAGAPLLPTRVLSGEIVGLVVKIVGVLFGAVFLLGFLSGLVGDPDSDRSGGKGADPKRSRRHKRSGSDGGPPTSGETYGVNDYGELVERDE
jgi:hypothetical protein